MEGRDVTSPQVPANANANDNASDSAPKTVRRACPYCGQMANLPPLAMASDDAPQCAFCGRRAGEQGNGESVELAPVGVAGDLACQRCMRRAESAPPVRGDGAEPSAP